MAPKSSISAAVLVVRMNCISLYRIASTEKNRPLRPAVRRTHISSTSFYLVSCRP
jgi:hypothetical protein